MRCIIFAVMLCAFAANCPENAIAQGAPSQSAQMVPPKPQPSDKNADGAPRYQTYEDYIEALVDWKIERRLEQLKESTQPSQVSPRAPNVATGTNRACSPAIDSQIDGDFNGWEGETIYRLQNGQVWRQSSYHYHYHYAFSPHVLIFDSGAGCAMVVRDDDDDPVHVERLK